MPGASCTTRPGLAWVCALAHTLGIGTDIENGEAVGGRADRCLCPRGVPCRRAAAQPLAGAVAPPAGREGVVNAPPVPYPDEIRVHPGPALLAGIERGPSLDGPPSAVRRPGLGRRRHAARPGHRGRTARSRRRGVPVRQEAGDGGVPSSPEPARRWSWSTASEGESASSKDAALTLTRPAPRAGRRRGDRARPRRHRDPRGAPGRAGLRGAPDARGRGRTIRRAADPAAHRRATLRRRPVHAR